MAKGQIDWLSHEGWKREPVQITSHNSEIGAPMTPYDLERVLAIVRDKRAIVKNAGIDEADCNMQPLICSMLEALLQHAADVEADRRLAAHHD